ncbi:ATP-dependent zinc metalloprotease FtsH [Mycoplasma anatis]|uniref:ATP-dependent zinc metalloprotease FtsH n=1 Tax=Mycoplasmopsis anatis TaxID=171279 RepID=A0A9Q3QF16_9BACT|nr:ATP-dependent zinc metalloprotease FtsH [Mycoplasmopsis anatis]MBW0596541.1 ATP-dependent zinc metalloprotease FtsH [Mycoplasmopsis anatis]MBW0602372.1 ATP-dependent zinc metalloprotease FtsH [Mycoplasmopsis anatis]MBW0603886.1 ATP-dependent zinc metalloprotease FtsH [Mycoplasmopsis anatis]
MKNNKQNPRKIWVYGFLVIVLLAIATWILFDILRFSAYKNSNFGELLSQIQEIVKTGPSDTNKIQNIVYDPNTNLTTWTVVSSIDGKLVLNNYRAGGALQSYMSILGNITFTEFPDVSFSDLLYQATNKTFDVSQAIPKQTPTIVSWLVTLLPTILIIGVIGFFMWITLKMNSGAGGSGILGDKSPAQKIISDKKFKDVAGNQEPIEEIKEIVDYLKNPKKYKDSGARMPHGILLGGPPGTGKTLIAKATAGEANVPFYYISASSFVEMFVGLGAKRVRQVVAEARKNPAAIIFIDELDAIGRTRGSGIGGGHDEREQTLNQLLVEMDGMESNAGILYIAATNRVDVLDPALTRPGRFDRTITVGLPNVKEREDILKLHAKGKRFDSNVDFKNIAKRTPGYSGAQLENVINEATLLSVRENSNKITLAILDEAIDRVMSGPAKKTRVITKEELTMVAYHEAGHAVVGIKVPSASKVQKITIVPRGDAGGYNLIIPEEEKYNMTKSELLATIASYMGGRAAESIIYGQENISTGAGSDIDRATNIARKMVTQYGMSDLGPVKYENDEGSPFLGRTLATNSNYSSKIGHEIDLEVRKIISDALALATKTIQENRELLELIKERLLQKETIVSEEIDYIAKNLRLPEDPQEEQVKSDDVNVSIDDLIKSVEE